MAKEEQIKSQIILEGEKEYRAACKGINTSLREIGSEMKLATAEFGDNAESIEALTRKQDILQKQLDEQAKKAKAAEAALKKMREGGIDPTDPAYQKMQTNLNNTRAEMVKVQRELDDTSKKLKSSKIDWESVGNTVGKVGKAIGAGVAAMGAKIGAAAFRLCRLPAAMLAPATIFFLCLFRKCAYIFHVHTSSRITFLIRASSTRTRVPSPIRLSMLCCIFCISSSRRNVSVIRIKSPLPFSPSTSFTGISAPSARLKNKPSFIACLLYTSDAADEL